MRLFLIILTLISSHFAFAEECLYYGWPSQISSGACQRPSNYAASSCSASQTRCNPALFGSSTCVSSPHTTNTSDIFDHCRTANGGKVELSSQDPALLRQSRVTTARLCNTHPTYLFNGQESSQRVCSNIRADVQNFLPPLAASITQLVGNYNTPNPADLLRTVSGISGSDPENVASCLQAGNPQRCSRFSQVQAEIERNSCSTITPANDAICLELALEYEALENLVPFAVTYLDQFSNVEGCSPDLLPAELLAAGDIANQAQAACRPSVAEQRAQSRECAETASCMMAGASLTMVPGASTVFSHMISGLNVGGAVGRCADMNISCNEDIARYAYDATVQLLKSVWGVARRYERFQRSLYEMPVGMIQRLVGASDESYRDLALTPILEEDQETLNSLVEIMLREKDNFIPFMFNQMMTGFQQWLQYDIFCEEFSVVNGQRECVRPSEGVGCTSCGTMMQGLCRIQGTLLPELMLAFMTGGIANAVGRTATGARIAAQLANNPVLRRISSGRAAIRNAMVSSGRFVFSAAHRSEVLSNLRGRLSSIRLVNSDSTAPAGGAPGNIANAPSADLVASQRARVENIYQGAGGKTSSSTGTPPPRTSTGLVVDATRPATPGSPDRPGSPATPGRVPGNTPGLTVASPGSPGIPGTPARILTRNPGPDQWTAPDLSARRLTPETFPVGDQQDYVRWARDLRRVEGTNNPFGEDADLLSERLRQDAGDLDPGTQSHMVEHRRFRQQYAEQLRTLGIDDDYFELLQEAHDMGKYYVSDRDRLMLQEQHAEAVRAALREGRDPPGEFRYPAIPRHDIGTAEHLLELGQEMNIDPRRMEHLLADITGHNDGSTLDDVFWSERGWPRMANGEAYPRPSSREGWMLTILDRFGQGSHTGAVKISNTVSGFGADLRSAVLEGYGSNPTNTIRQLQAIEERFIDFSRNDPNGRPIMNPAEVRAVRGIIDDGIRTQNATVQFLNRNIRWGDDGLATLLDNDGRPIIINGNPLTASTIQDFNNPGVFSERVAQLIEGHRTAPPAPRSAVVAAAEDRTAARHQAALVEARAALENLPAGDSPARVQAVRTVETTQRLADQAVARADRVRRDQPYLTVEELTTPTTRPPPTQTTPRSPETGVTPPAAGARSPTRQASGTPPSRERTPLLDVSDSNRISTARTLLGRSSDFTTSETEAIWRAHRAGSGGIGNYSWPDIREKRRILAEAGFNPIEIRQLMESGITGERVRYLLPDTNTYLAHTTYPSGRYQIPAVDPQASTSRWTPTPSLSTRVQELGRMVQGEGNEIRAFLPRHANGSHNSSATAPVLTLRLPEAQGTMSHGVNIVEYTGYLIDENTIQLVVGGGRRRNVRIDEIVENFDSISIRRPGSSTPVTIVDNGGMPLNQHFGLESPYRFQRELPTDIDPDL